MTSRTRDPRAAGATLSGLSAVALVLVATASVVVQPPPPTRGEIVRVVASLVLVTTALRAGRPLARVLAAALWLLVLTAAGLSLRAAELGADFETFYAGADALFDEHRSPYVAHGATAFPFPTFPLVRLLSLGGRLDGEQSYVAFVGLQVVLLGLGLAVLLALLDRCRSRRDPASLVLQAGLVLQPPILAGLGWGNSGALAGTLIALALWLWRGHDGRPSLHAAAVSLNLAWMVKPQLLMAAAFFVVAAAVEWRAVPSTRSRAARIGRLLVPWAAALVALSLPLALPGSLRAYGDFLRVAEQWHTEIAETHSNNLAVAALLAKAASRLAAAPLADVLPATTATVAALVLVANLYGAARSRDAIGAGLPWLVASLLWTSLVWDWYLTLVLAAPLIMVARHAERPGSAWASLRLSAGVAGCTTASAYFFPLGVVLLFMHALALRREAGGEPGGPGGIGGGRGGGLGG